MENFAHAFAGLLVAELGFVALAKRTGSAPPRGFRRVAYGVSAAANNVPDLDQLYLGITPGKLGYMLHHRGHTHTLALGVLLGLLVGVIGLAIDSRIARSEARSDPQRRARRVALLAIAALGPVVHIAMDGWNSYGVHPFWPLDRRWFYGDTIFIVEPLLWVTAIPTLLRAAEAWAWKAVLGLLLVVALALPWAAAAIMPLPVRLALLGVALALVALARLPNARHRLATWAGAWLFVLATFAIGRSLAARRLAADLGHEGAQLTVLDAALTPLPANPLCWMVVLTARADSDADAIVSRVGYVSLAGPRVCPEPDEARPTAPLTAIVSQGSTRWAGELRQSRSELLALDERCDVAAALRFIRSPYWVLRDGSLVVGDLRFDRDEKLDFTDLELPAGPPAECPPFVPDWVPPRAELLQR